MFDRGSSPDPPLSLLESMSTHVLVFIPAEEGFGLAAESPVHALMAGAGSVHPDTARPSVFIPAEEGSGSLFHCGCCSPPGSWARLSLWYLYLHCLYGYGNNWLSGWWWMEWPYIYQLWDGPKRWRGGPLNLSTTETYGFQCLNEELSRMWSGASGHLHRALSQRPSLLQHEWTCTGVYSCALSQRPSLIRPTPAWVDRDPSKASASPPVHALMAGAALFTPTWRRPDHSRRQT